MPYIHLIRADIPPAVLQHLDLYPNTSQRSLVYQPVGQTLYSSLDVASLIGDPTNSISDASVPASEDVTVVGTIALGDQLSIDTVANALSAAGETFTAAAAAGGVYPAIEFERAAGDAATTATNLATEINLNSRIVTASVLGAVVTLTARINGTAGNSVDLVASIEGGGAGTAFTLGAAVLSGGVDGAVTTTEEISGLTAYLLDRVCNAQNSIGSGGSLETSVLPTASVLVIANLIRDFILAGVPIPIAIINAAINTPADVADSDLDGAGATSNSYGTMVDVLRLLSGEPYTIPSGVTLATSAAGKTVFSTTATGAFPTTSTIRSVYVTGALQISVSEGKLAGFLSPNFTYLGVTGPAVVVYNDDGTIF